MGKSLNKLGVCPESMWPYNVDRFTDKSDESCYKEARRDRALRYRKVAQDLSHLKHCLAAEQRPIVFGFSVYESFESDEVKQTGKMPMPDVSAERLLGGHAVCAVGYNDQAGCFIVRNSWGEDWGMDGYFLMPYQFITDPDFASDFWVIDTVSDGADVSPVASLAITS